MVLFKAFSLMIIFICTTNGQGINFESPWVWACADRGCVKVDKSLPPVDNEKRSSLAECKLTCDPQAMLWPKPRGESTLGNFVVSFREPEALNFRTITAPKNEVETLMKEAIGIFESFLEKTITSGVKKSEASKTKSSNNTKQKSNSQVNIDIEIDTDETLLKMTTSESYSLTVETTFSKSKGRQSTNTSTTTVKISAESFFGARHALETLSQLIAWDESIDSMILLGQASIKDSPAYIHRGLLIDTSRNFVSVEIIKKILDGMSYDKLNIFHWHLTDSHSFPFVSKRRPKLAQYGAYSASKVYTPEAIKDIVHYATVRGIKVIPEYDAPAHVGAGWEWSEKDGLGEMVLCYNKEPWGDYCVEPPCGQLNPVNDNVYNVLNDIYRDMKELFPSDIFHMGGDEVHFRCWNETKEIVDWLAAQNRMNRSKEDFVHVWTHFQERALEELDIAYDNKQPVVLWTSGLTEDGHANDYLDKSRYIIQIWTKEDDKSIAELYSQGFKLIMSNYDAWYFDCGYGAWVGNSTNNWCSPYIGWQKAYMNSPKQMIINFDLTYNAEQVLGGEAALWTEQVDSASMEGKLWPRSSAVAERLWTDPETDWRAAETRMYHHRRRLSDRGIFADALQPEWCHQHEGYCFL